MIPLLQNFFYIIPVQQKIEKVFLKMRRFFRKERKQLENQRSDLKY